VRRILHRHPIPSGLRLKTKYGHIDGAPAHKSDDFRW
jgi:hypothetical protein